MDRIVSSTAARAWSTALRFQEAFDKRIPMMRRRDLYHADEMSLLAIALEEAGTDDGARIMLVGHNPGIHDLALLLCGEGGPAETASLQAKFPTGTLAEFDLSGRPTLEIPPGAGRLLRFTRPKDLPVAKRPERPRRDRPATRPG